MARMIPLHIPVSNDSPAERKLSSERDTRRMAVVDAHHPHNALCVVDLIHHSVRSASGNVIAGELQA